MATAKIFKRGNSQAARLPKEVRFAGTEVQIKRSEQVMAVVSRFKGKIERRQPKDQIRQWR